MASIDFFYQGEGLREIEHIEVDSDLSFGDVKAVLIEKHALNNEVLIFLEDSDEPLDELLIVHDHTGPVGVKAHIHRSRHVEVGVTFNGETVHHRFGPGTTIARVKRWATDDKFRMSKDDAGEHVLQITGTQERPAPSTHLGALVAYPNCHVSFDLVPDQRVNGACSGTVA